MTQVGSKPVLRDKINFGLRERERERKKERERERETERK